jgi:hypothetical protein
MLKKSELLIEKNSAGAWVISALIGGYLVTEQFYFYTKKEATREFMNERKGKK